MDSYDSPNSAEYAVEKKSEGRVRLLRTLMILGYVAFCTAYIVLTCGVTKMPALIAGLPLFLYIIWLCTWRLVSYDVSYTFQSGTMTFYRIVGSRRIPRERLKLHVRDAELIAPASSESAREADLSGARCFDFTSSPSSPNAVLLVGRDALGRRVAVRFDCIRRVAKLMKTFCPVSELNPADYGV